LSQFAGLDIGLTNMRSIRTRLSLNYLFVLITGMSLAGLLVWLAVSDLYIKTQSENLLAQAKLIAAGLQDSTLQIEPVQPYSQMANVLPGVHTRLIGDSGAVIMGLPLSNEMIQLSEAEQFASIPPSELIQRPEIESALKGTPSTAVREVLGNQRVLYAAAPIQDSAGQISGIVYIATPLPSTGLPLNVIFQLLGGVLIAALIAAFAGRLLARRIAIPLEELAAAAKAVSSGDLDQAVSTNQDILEFQSVHQTFNEMIINLRQSDETKKAFIADVTHELRTPLTVIKGTIETLEDGALDDLEGRSSLLTSMMRETDRLIRMVNELLVLTRADAGSLHLNIQDIDLTELVQMRCENMRLMSARQNVELKVNGGVQFVSADPDRLSQVLDNLLANAIRHSPENSIVIVDIQSKMGGVECSVSDSGTGIPEKHLPFIFDRFYRVDSSRDRLSGGSGLGLAIARSLIMLHGGSISAKSVEGKGTIITFWLPAKVTSS
jgi:signal transduction histidine kinase